MPGIFLLALNALTVLIQKKCITDPPSSIDAKRQWRRDADTVEQFKENCCKTGDGYQSRSGDLWDAYLEFCEQANVDKPVNQNTFGRRLSELGYATTTGTGNIRMRSGIEIDYALLEANKSHYVSQGSGRTQNGSRYN
jgi:putative DNA primase/helicase